jgi:hypothetical protein
MKTRLKELPEQQSARILAVILLLLVLSWAWLNGVFHAGEHCGKTVGQGFNAESVHPETMRPASQ